MISQLKCASSSFVHHRNSVLTDFIFWGGGFAPFENRRRTSCNICLVICGHPSLCLCASFVLKILMCNCCDCAFLMNNQFTYMPSIFLVHSFIIVFLGRFLKCESKMKNNCSFTGVFRTFWVYSRICWRQSGSLVSFRMKRFIQFSDNTIVFNISFWERRVYFDYIRNHIIPIYDKFWQNAAKRSETNTFSILFLHEWQINTSLGALLSNHIPL